MFLNMVRRPNKGEAYKKLKSHVSMFAACVVIIRATPYVLHFLTKEKEELKLEF